MHANPPASFPNTPADALPMTPRLIQLIYASAAGHELRAEELAALLETSRVNNARLGLTGMLLYAEGSLFQVLEGQPEVVESLYAKIERDPRHEQVTTIIKEPIPKRSFDAWTMGFHKVSNEELVSLSGVNDFFGKGAMVTVDAGRARKLLAAFRDGRWRKKPTGGRPLAAY